jgi:esterase
MILFERHFGAGEPLLILHGLFGQSDNWTTIARKLGETYCVYTIDLRNHGQSGHDDQIDYQVMAEDVRETCEAIGLKKVHLLGHSMGGKVAMTFGMNYPALLFSLLIADIGPRYYTPHHQEILSGLNRINTETISSRQEAENQLAEVVQDSSTRQFLLKNLYRKEDNGFAWRFNLSGLTASIERVGDAFMGGTCFVPTLFYHGEKSRYILPSEYADIRELFPNAEFRVMEGAGHWLHAENPTAFIETTRWWLSKNTHS